MFLPEWVVSRRVYEFLTSKYPRMNFEPMFLKTENTKKTGDGSVSLQM